MNGLEFLGDIPDYRPLHTASFVMGRNLLTGTQVPTVQVTGGRLTGEGIGHNKYEGCLNKSTIASQGTGRCTLSQVPLFTAYYPLHAGLQSEAPHDPS